MSLNRVPYSEEQKHRDEERQKDVKYHNDNYEQFLKQYPEQWIGILGQQVIAAAFSETQLIAQLKVKGISWDLAFRSHLTERDYILIPGFWDANYD